MRGREFLEKMELVSPAYVEAAGRAPQVRAKRWPKLVAAAACLCLVVWGAYSLSGGWGRVPGPTGVPDASGQPEASGQPGETPIGADGPTMEPCPGTLGFEECWVQYEGTADAANWWYYTGGGDGRYELVAQSWWNAKSAAPYEVDLDGDGVKELIFNLNYEDGFREVQIIRRRDGEVQNCYFDNAFLRDHWEEQGLTTLEGATQHIRSYYDPERGIVLEADCYDPAGREVLSVEVFHDLEHFNYFIDELHTHRGPNPQPSQTPAVDGGEAMAAYRDVLDGTAEFTYIPNHGESQKVNISNVKSIYNPELPDTYPLSIDFTVLDLNGDGGDEVVLSVDGSGAVGCSIVLHYQDGTVYGFRFYPRSLGSLKADGTFRFSSSAADHGFGRLTFARPGYYAVDRITYCKPEGDGWEDMLYVVDHQTATADEFDAAVSEFYDREEPVWHELTQENVAEELGGGEPSPQPTDEIGKFIIEECPPTLGFDECWVVRDKSASGIHTWYFYARMDDGTLQCIAETCSYLDGPDVYRVDLDGDGVDELICNNTFGDGVEEAYIYRYYGVGVDPYDPDNTRTDNIVFEVGWLAPGYWDVHGMGAVNGRSVRYDPERGFVATGYDLEGNPKEEVVQEDFRFGSYQPLEPAGARALLELADIPAGG